MRPGLSARLRWRPAGWARGREFIFSIDRLGYTGPERAMQQRQTRALLKLVWNLER